MEQLINMWNALETRRRVIVVAAGLAMFVAVLALARIAASPSLSLLYAGLEPGAAGDVVAALEAEGVAHEIRGDGIYVDTARRDELRMTLAAEGLPANSSRGYELLDTLSGFGTTSQMFDAAYWRAKEGELARTIMSSPGITAARVHIATPAATGLRPRGEPTASVTVTTSDGTVSAAHAKALKFLIASAVPGLAPEDVSVIDTRGGLIQSGDAVGADTTSDRAATLKRNVERLLEARVGFGNAIVELSLDTAQESETIRERVYDPEGRVAIATETTETANSASESGDGAVTVASNLPAGDAGASGSNSNSNASETRERVNYEVSETTREIMRAPGTVRRISVAVLVDGLRGVDDAGEPTWTPRTEEELAALRDLVAGAVGFDEGRGDTITIRTMEFEPLVPAGTEGAAGVLARLGIELMGLVQLAVLAAVALVLGLFVLRPALSSGGAAPVLPPVGPEPTEPSETIADLPTLTGEIEEGAFDGPDMAVVSDFDFDDGTLPALGSAAGDPVARLRHLIEERQAETVEILRGWMEDDEEATA